MRPIRRLFFDLETTGMLPFKGRDFISPKKFEKFPRIVEIAWVLTENHSIVKQQRHIIKPRGFTISEEVSKIHGIYHDQAVREGIEIEEMLTELKTDMKDVRWIVGHNVKYDYYVLMSELYRHNKPIMADYIQFSCKKFCTMLYAHKIYKMKKWPRLGALYEQLMETPLEDAHTALADTMACLECYNKMKNIK